jgi:hypothetical protein
MKKLLTVIFMLGMLNIVFGQNNKHNRVKLDSISVSGTAILVKKDSLRIQYYLDKDGNGVPDYLLVFGPAWYTPDSSAAVRPANGDNITILGGLTAVKDSSIAKIIVYEINGEFWRDPFYSSWNSLGHGKFHNNRRWGNRGHRRHHDNSGFGWEHDSLVTVSVTGTALVDTTYYISHYYLDVDNDGTPDYYLNFGPYWYMPESGAVRPENGATVDIVGGLLEKTDKTTEVIIVFELNGQVWRDSSALGKHFGGGWLSADDSAKTFHASFDKGDYITFHKGWKKKRTGRWEKRVSDSLFCQMFEIAHESLDQTEQKIFACYEINMLQPDGSDLLVDENGNSRHFELANKADFHFHYSLSELKSISAEDNLAKTQAKEISVSYWDDVTESWVIVEDAIINTDENTVEFSSSVVSNLVALSVTEVTAVEKKNNIVPIEFSVSQNYPNPFNPTTRIEFSIPQVGLYALKVYNVLGEEVATIVNKEFVPGTYSYSFNANNLSSGIYLYKLVGNNVNITKKMMLVK